MSDDRLGITTEEQRRRLAVARRTGAACGRPLDPEEIVYRERFRLAPMMLGTGKVLVAASVVRGPVGRECDVTSWSSGATRSNMGRAAP
jgi:hypothetical protein